MLVMFLHYFLMIAIDSIPHASSSGNSHNNGQKPNPISPTNSTNPVNKESALANDENTTVPEYEQLSNLPLKRDKVDPSVSVNRFSLTKR